MSSKSSSIIQIKKRQTHQSIYMYIYSPWDEKLQKQKKNGGKSSLSSPKPFLSKEEDKGLT